MRVVRGLVDSERIFVGFIGNISIGPASVAGVVVHHVQRAEFFSDYAIKRPLYRGGYVAGYRDSYAHWHFGKSAGSTSRADPV